MIASTLRERPSGSEEGLVGYYGFEDQGTYQTADGSALGVTRHAHGVSLVREVDGAVPTSRVFLAVTCEAWAMGGG
jgi:hypothetical protein